MGTVNNKNDEYRNILVCGDKSWKNKKLIETVLKFVVGNPARTTVIHSGNYGAEKIAGYTASLLGCSVVRVLAKWICYSREAESLRIEIMLNHSPDFVIGFHSDIKSSTDTKETIIKAREEGIRTYLIAGEQDLPPFSALFLKESDDSE